MKVIYSSVIRVFPAFNLVVADFCPAHVQALKSFFSKSPQQELKVCGKLISRKINEQYILVNFE